MSNLEQIEASNSFIATRWMWEIKAVFLDLDNERWDKQIEQDIEDGKLEAFAQEAIAESEAVW